MIKAIVLNTGYISEEKVKMVITIKIHEFKRNYYQFGKTSTRPNNGLTFRKSETCVNFLCGGSSGNINKFTSIADTPRAMKEWFDLYEIDGDYDFEGLTQKLVSGEISEIKILRDLTIKVVRKKCSAKSIVSIRGGSKMSVESTDLNFDNFDDVILYAEQEGYLPDEIYCDDCGLAKITMEQSFDLEEIFSRESTMPVMVDICDCKKDGEQE